MAKTLIGVAVIALVALLILVAVIMVHNTVQAICVSPVCYSNDFAPLVALLYLIMILLMLVTLATIIVELV